MLFAKGHGTGNDFLVIPDPDDQLALSPELVARLCDRRTGLGADGVLRAVRSSALRHSWPEQLAPRPERVAPAPSPESSGGAGQLGCPGDDHDAEWFMDYRNADGSLAEMCGNGVRVFARYLLDRQLTAGPEVTVATMAGVRRVRENADGDLTVDMGPVRVLGRGRAVVGDRDCEGLALSVGNPHLACLVAEPVASFDLSAPPAVDAAAFRDGVNVELLRVTGPRQLEMRVHERGSGVTLSCGTGAVAAAAAAAVAAGELPAEEDPSGQRPDGPGRSWIVDVPGGRLAVTPSVTASLLTGPAVIVAEGHLEDAWLARLSAAPSGIA
ncbi:MAG TPA: diaminopimelate epimerase [Streptosporangiaceae bacterium]